MEDHGTTMCSDNDIGEDYEGNQPAREHRRDSGTTSGISELIIHEKI